MSIIGRISREPRYCDCNTCQGQLVNYRTYYRHHPPTVDDTNSQNHEHILEQYSEQSISSEPDSFNASDISISSQSSTYSGESNNFVDSDTSSDIAIDEHMPIENDFQQKSDFESLPEQLGPRTCEQMRFLCWKVDFKVGENASNALFKSIDSLKHMSIYKLKQILQEHTNVAVEHFDCCINSCMAFTREYQHLDKCSICNQDRYILKKGVRYGRKKFHYIGVTGRLKTFWSTKKGMNRLSYQRSLEKHHDIQDFHDGEYFRRYIAPLCEIKNDMIFSFSTDGVKVFRKNHADMWPLLLTNLSLDPRERFKFSNLLSVGIIPGPHGPKKL